LVVASVVTFCNFARDKVLLYVMVAFPFITLRDVYRKANMARFADRSSVARSGGKIRIALTCDLD